MQWHYEITTTFLTMIPGAFASAVAFYFVSRRQRTGLQIVSGSLLLGLGIGAIHYLGMAAMRLDGYIQYGPSPAMSLRKGDELAITVTLMTSLWILLLSVIAAAIVTGTARQLRASEYALQRRSRSLAMLSAGNRTLVRSDDEQELLQKMCAVAVETGGYQMPQSIGRRRAACM